MQRHRPVPPPKELHKSTSEAQKASLGRGQETLRTCQHRLPDCWTPSTLLWCLAAVHISATTHTPPEFFVSLSILKQNPSPLLPGFQCTSTPLLVQYCNSTSYHSRENRENCLKMIFQFCDANTAGMCSRNPVQAKIQHFFHSLAQKNPLPFFKSPEDSAGFESCTHIASGLFLFVCFN